MRLPAPKPGLVIRYDFVWRHDENQVTGKERPACLVAVAETDPRLVVILPITHSPPHGTTVGIEIPLKVSRALGLDELRSWVVVSEANIDHWPNAGLASVPGKQSAFAYGFLPPGLFDSIKTRFFELLAERRAHAVQRR
ncbi:MAG TPA: hypothetical protein VGG48_09580 [Rhizomicrobium sp.]|jgi:hypothetical protein